MKLFEPANIKLKLLIVSLVCITQISCDDLLGSGSDKFVKKVDNPSHTKQAILFLRSGGATSGYSLQVSIHDAGNDLDTTEVGNVFTADDNHGKASLDSAEIKLKWLSDKKLEINYNEKLRTFIQAHSYDDNVVLYTTF